MPRIQGFASKSFCQTSSGCRYVTGEDAAGTDRDGRVAIGLRRFALAGLGLGGNSGGGD